MEAIVAKLSGFAKFDVKTKISCSNFEEIMNTISTTDEEGLNNETFDTYASIFERVANGEVPF